MKKAAKKINLCQQKNMYFMNNINSIHLLFYLFPKYYATGFSLSLNNIH